MIGSPIGTKIWRAGLVLAGVSLVTAVFLASQSSGSKQKKVATTIRIATIDADHVSGTVSSSRAACRRDRKVRLHGATEKKTFGSARSNGRGRYRLNVRLGLGAGTYYADVDKVIREGRENGRKVRFLCRGDESIPLTL